MNLNTTLVLVYTSLPSSFFLFHAVFRARGAGIVHRDEAGNTNTERSASAELNF